jgi:hypothetical protein
MPSLWAEIYYPRETRWIRTLLHSNQFHAMQRPPDFDSTFLPPPCDQPDVDIVRNAVDQPQYYEETYPSIQLAYVASLAGTR